MYSTRRPWIDGQFIGHGACKRQWGPRDDGKHVGLYRRAALRRAAGCTSCRRHAKHPPRRHPFSFPTLPPSQASYTRYGGFTPNPCASSNPEAVSFDIPAWTCSTFSQHWQDKMSLSIMRRSPSDPIRRKQRISCCLHKCTYCMVADCMEPDAKRSLLLLYQNCCWQRSHQKRQDTETNYNKGKAATWTAVSQWWHLVHCLLCNKIPYDVMS